MGSPLYETVLETLIKEIQWNTYQYNETCLQWSFSEILSPPASILLKSYLKRYSIKNIFIIFVVCVFLDDIKVLYV